MGQAWLELRYGLKGLGITLCKSNNPQLLKVFKEYALSEAEQMTKESEGVDQVIHYVDQAELERLNKLLGLLVPDTESGD